VAVNCDRMRGEIGRGTRECRASRAASCGDRGGENAVGDGMGGTAAARGGGCWDGGAGEGRATSASGGTEPDSNISTA
jgi:hypothetical protein